MGTRPRAIRKPNQNCVEQKGEAAASSLCPTVIMIQVAPVKARVRFGRASATTARIPSQSEETSICQSESEPRDVTVTAGTLAPRGSRDKRVKDVSGPTRMPKMPTAGFELKPSCRNSPAPSGRLFARAPLRRRSRRGGDRPLLRRSRQSSPAATEIEKKLASCAQAPALARSGATRRARAPAHTQDPR